MSKWTNEEVDFIMMAYPSKDYTTKEIAEILNRSVAAVKKKAFTLNLNAYKEELPKGYKRCTKCDNILPFEFFAERGDKQGLKSYCKTCGVRIMKEYRNKIKGKVVLDETIDGIVLSKTCKECKETKDITQFYKNSGNKDGYDNYCKICSKKRKEQSELKRMKEKGW